MTETTLRAARDGTPIVHNFDDGSFLVVIINNVAVDLKYTANRDPPAHYHALVSIDEVIPTGKTLRELRFILSAAPTVIRSFRNSDVATSIAHISWDYDKVPLRQVPTIEIQLRPT